MQLKKAVLGLLIVFFTVNGFSQKPDFSVYKRFTGSGTPIGAVAHDFNQDGFLDAVKVTGSSIELIQGLGDGEFKVTSLGMGSNTGGVTLVKYSPTSTGLAITGSNVVYLVGISMGETPGANTSQVVVGTNPVSITANDFNNDGMEDLAVANKGSNDISLLLATGIKQFAPAISIPAGNKPTGIVSGNFNNDSFRDIAVLNSNDNTIRVYLGNGDATFNNPSITTIGTNYTYITASDLNKDGIDDLALSNYVEGVNPNGKVTVLSNDGKGAFPSDQSFIIPDVCANLFFIDIEADGEKEILASTPNGKFYILSFGNYSVTSVSYASNYTSGNFIFAGNTNSDSFLDILMVGWDVYSVRAKKHGEFYVPTFNPITSDGLDKMIKADFNNDNIPDVLYSASYRKVACSLGDGKGYLIPTSSFTIPGDLGAAEFTYGDFNNDGNLDIAIATDYFHSNSFLHIYLGDGKGGFAPGLVKDIDNEPNDIRSSDFNNDGFVDIIIAHAYPSNSTTKNLSVLLGNGTGTFASIVKSVAGDYANDIAIADFNKDGIKDIAVVNASTSYVHINNMTISLGDGAGGFTLTQGFYTGANPREVKVTDLNNDGINDLVLSSYNDLSSFLGDGKGNFSRIKHSTMDYLSYTEIGDFNGDNFKDVVVTTAGSDSYKSKQILVYSGFGNGDFASPVEIQSSNAASSFGQDVLSGDFNSDNKIDLLVYDNGSLVILENTSLPTFNSPSIVSASASFTDITPTSMKLSWTNGNGANRLVMLREALPVEIMPLDGYTYINDGTDIGQGHKVVYIGDGNSISLTNLKPNTRYYFAIVEYNGANEVTNYLTSTVLLADATTPQILYTGTLPVSEICAGGTITVPYTTNYAFSASAVFEAYLSDANGDFTNASYIGSGKSSPIIVTIPYNVVSGNGYRIRIQASAPLTNGDDNGADLKIIALPKSELIVGTKSSCYNQDGSVIVVLSQIGVTYQAFIGNTSVSDKLIGTGNNITLSIPTSSLSVGANTIQIKASNGGCETTLYNQPVVNKIANPNLNYQLTGESVCEGTASKALLSGSEDGIWYQLFKDEIPVGVSIKGNGSPLIFPIPVTSLVQGNNTFGIQVSIYQCDNTVALPEKATIYVKEGSECLVTSNPVYSESNIRVFPNPVVDDLIIRFQNTHYDEVNVQIRNLLGVVLYSDIKKHIGEEYSISFVDLAAGAYIIELKSGKEIILNEFILKK